MQLLEVKLQLHNKVAITCRRWKGFKGAATLVKYCETLWAKIYPLNLKWNLCGDIFCLYRKFHISRNFKWLLSVKIKSISNTKIDACLINHKLSTSKAVILQKVHVSKTSHFSLFLNIYNQIAHNQDLCIIFVHLLAKEETQQAHNTLRQQLSDEIISISWKLFWTRQKLRTSWHKLFQAQNV